MTALDDIEATAGALNALTAAEQAEKARIDAAVAALLASKVSPTRVIFLDAAAGDDANDGTTPQRAVRTPAQAFALGSAGQHLAILLCSDVALTTPLLVAQSASFTSDWLAAYGYDTGQARRKLIVTPSAFTNGAIPINQIFEGGDLIFNGVELHTQSVPAGASLGVIGVRNQLQFYTTTLSWDAPMNVPLIEPFPLTSIYFAGVQFPSDYAGKIFAGIPAGGDINQLRPGTRSNLTSA